VLIARCAWHPRNFGHAKLLGVSRWSGVRIQFTDGICRKCAARVRVTRRTVPPRTPAAPGGGRLSEIIVVALAVLTGLLLIAQPANEGASPFEVAGLLPSAVTIAPASMVEPRPAPARVRRLAPVPRAATVDVRERATAERLQAP
jgi:hypothetical protein